VRERVRREVGGEERLDRVDRVAERGIEVVRLRGLGHRDLAARCGSSTTIVAALIIVVAAGGEADAAAGEGHCCQQRGQARLGSVAEDRFSH
jgi:hypothetical protein